MSRAVMQQALAYIEEVDYGPYDKWPVILALKQALAEPEQKPVAWELRMGKTDRVLMEITNNPERAQNWRASLCEVVPLYYAPTPRKPDLEALNAELVEALRGLSDEVERFGLHHPDGNSNWWPVTLEKAQAALAKCEVSK